MIANFENIIQQKETNYVYFNCKQDCAFNAHKKRIIHVETSDICDQTIYWNNIKRKLTISFRKESKYWHKLADQMAGFSPVTLEQTASVRRFNQHVHTDLLIRLFHISIDDILRVIWQRSIIHSLGVLLYESQTKYIMVLYSYIVVFTI